MEDAVKAESQTTELVVLEHTKQDGFYRRLRRRVEDWAATRTGRENRWLKYVLAAPDLFHLLCRLSVDLGVPPKVKVRLVLVIAYFVSPLDFFPEAVLGPIGYLDDIALAAFFLDQLVNAGGAAVVRRHWAGDGDVLELIRGIAATADEMVGSGLWEKIRKMLSD